MGAISRSRVLRSQRTFAFAVSDGGPGAQGCLGAFGLVALVSTIRLVFGPSLVLAFIHRFHSVILMEARCRLLHRLRALVHVLGV